MCVCMYIGGQQQCISQEQTEDRIHFGPVTASESTSATIRKRRLFYFQTFALEMHLCHMMSKY